MFVALATWIIGAFSIVPDVQSPAPSPAAAAPSAQEIYSRAVHEMQALAKTGNPPYIVFDLSIDSHNLHWYPTVDDGVTSWDAKLVHANERSGYRIWYRAKDQKALVQDSATHVAYKGESPFVPETTDLSDVSGGKPSPRPTPSASPSPGADNGSTAAVKVIGAVTVNGNRYYAITLVGLEDHAGHPVYHLHLRAYRDAIDYPLTDLWVDTTDYRIWEAHGEVTIRAVAAAIGIGVTADFSPVDKYWLVSSIDFTMKGYLMMWHANTATSMRAHVIGTPARLPDAYFSP